MQVYHKNMKCCTQRKSLLYYQPISSAYLQKYYTVINFACSLLTCINLRKAVFKENKSFGYYKHLCSLMFKICFPTAFKVLRLKTMIASSEIISLLSYHQEEVTGAYHVNTRFNLLLSI